jgi:hypothetical protein
MLPAAAAAAAGAARVPGRCLGREASEALGAGGPLPTGGSFRSRTGQSREKRILCGQGCKRMSRTAACSGGKFAANKQVHMSQAFVPCAHVTETWYQGSPKPTLQAACLLAATRSVHVLQVLGAEAIEYCTASNIQLTSRLSR